MSRMKSILAVLMALTIVISCSIVIDRAVASDGVVDFVTRCYQKILGRNPDSGGLKSWSDQLRAGTKTAAEIINGFMNSTEYKNKYHTDVESVEILYNTMLDRKSDEAGLKYWLGYLKAGNSIGVVINGFCNSNEFRKLCNSYGIRPGSVETGTVKPPVTVQEVPREDPQKVEKIKAFVTRCYRVILSREPDAGGLNDWTNQLKSGKKCAAEIIEAFVNSNEFKNKHLSDSDSVEILYKAMLDRASDSEGKRYWLGYLNGGNTLSVVIDGFCRSTEFGKICSTYGIKPGTVNVGTVKPPVPLPDPEKLEKIRAFVTRCYKVILGREPDAGGLNDWSNQLANGKKTASEIINGFMNSNELKKKNLNMGQQVELLYQAMLGRASDAEGKKYWMAVLNGGNEIGVVINGFCNSTEFKKLCDTYGIRPGSVATGPVKPSVLVETNTTKTEVVEEAIAYEIIYQNDNTRYCEEGNKTIQQGKNGKARVTYEVEYNASGIKIKSTKIKQEVIENPVNAIISVPTKTHTHGTYEETKTVKVPFETVYEKDNTRAKGLPDIVIQDGKDGVKTIVYLVTFKDGVETKREVKSESITTKPVDKIISVASGGTNEGQAPVITTSRETKTETIPYTTETRNDPNRMAGEPDEILQTGKNGVRTTVYIVTYTNGVETNRSVESSSITTQPVKQIVSVATGTYTITYQTETVSIPFETTIMDAPNWYAGEEEIVTMGHDGEKEIKYEIKKDCYGNIVSWTVYSETITKQVVNQVIYRGTFVPVVTYSYVQVPNLPECDPSKRDASLDTDCAEWAMHMAKNNNVMHSGLGHGESVGAWGSIDGVVNGREYTVISTQDGQTYTGNVSLGSHGGGLLSSGDRWGAGCAIRSESQPDGTVVSVYFACARSELNN